MSDQETYWSKLVDHRLTRRRAIAATGSLAASAAFLAACGGNDKEEKPGTTTGTTSGPLDPTKGKPGGKLVWQGYGDVGGNLDLIAIPEYGIRQLSGLTHESLLQFRAGVAGIEPEDKSLQPELALALPEISPDKLKYTFKLGDSKFHDGKPVTAEDVVYSYNTYANGEKSAWKAFFLGWFGKIEAPDPKTVVVTTNFPFADAQQYFNSGEGINGFGDILSKSFQEGPDANKKLMGSGPFLFESHDSTVISKLKKNPDYHLKPYPYFDSLERTAYADPEKKIADFIGKNVQFTYWYDEAGRDRIKKARPEAQLWQSDAAAGRFTMRTDKAPWNDARVRRAMSMSIDRASIAKAVTQGEGKADQFLSWTGKFWGFREPKDLGANAKNWVYDIAEAKKLLAAANITQPIKAKVYHWNPTVIGPAWVQQMTLMKTGWKNNGIADIESVEQTHVQINAGAFLGNYGNDAAANDTLTWFPNVVAGQGQIGLNLLLFLSFPQGAPKAAPSLNSGFVDDPKLNDLLGKQLGQFDKPERVATFRLIEDLLADQQYHVINVTWTNSWFADPTLKNAAPHQEGYQGAWHQIKYWWFDKA
jgi:ABC-type transport system substrate-binding protein